MPPARRSLRSAVVAVLLLSALAAPRPAMAEDRAEPSQGPAIGCAVVSLIVPLGVMMTIALMPTKKTSERALAIALFAGGAVGLGFGATAIGLEATYPGPCDKDCKATNTVGGIGVGLGAVSVLFASIAVAYSSKDRSRRAVLVPGPLVIPTERGPVIGAGVSGFAF